MWPMMSTCSHRMAASICSRRLPVRRFVARLEPLGHAPHRVHAADDEIHLVDDLIRRQQVAVRVDARLDAEQHLDALVGRAGLHFGHGFAVLAPARRHVAVVAVLHVIGDGKALQP